MRGGPPGDLTVLINVRDHPRFMRRDADLLVRFPVSYPAVALGAELEIPTLDGAIARLTVPPGTQSGQVFEIKGRGMPSVNGGARGNLKVAVQVVTPRKLDDRERELLEELVSLRPEPSDLEENASWWDRLRSMFG